MSNIELLSKTININELLNMIEQSYAFLCLDDQTKYTLDEKAAKKSLEYPNINLAKARLIFNDIYNKYIKKQLEKDCNYIILDNYFEANKNNNFLTNLNNLFRMIFGIFDIDMALYVLNNEENENYVREIYEKNKEIIIQQGIEIISRNDILITLIEAYCNKNNIDLTNQDYFNIESLVKEESRRKKSKNDNDIYNEDAFVQYCKQIPNKILTYEEEVDLAYKIKNGDKQAEEKFVKHNLKLVIPIAKKYVGPRTPLLDLIQEGNFGLTKAVKKFNPDKHCKFSTYAIWWIRQSILSYLYNTKEEIRIPLNKQAEINKLRRCVERMRLKSGEYLDFEEIAKEMGISIKKVKELLEVNFEVISYDAPVSGTEHTLLQEILIIPDEVSIEDEGVKSILRSQLKDIMSKYLDSREYQVINYRFGLENNNPMSLEEVGKIFNITRERVRQIEAKALRKLREPFSDRDLSTEFNSNNHNLEISTSIKKLEEKQQITLEDKEILELLKLITEDEKAILKDGLGDNTYSILLRKFGKEYQSITHLSLKEEKKCKNEIYPYLRNLLLKYRGYYYYKQLFRDKDETSMIEAFYSLTLSEQKILIDCYGPYLTNCLDNRVSKEKVSLLIKVSSKLKRHISSNNLRNSLNIFNENYNLYNLSQNFNILLGEVYKDESYKNFDFLAYRVFSKLEESLKCILKVILNDEEYEVINLFYGLDNNIYLKKTNIAKKLKKSEKKINDIYNKAILKLRMSPHLNNIFKNLNKNTRDLPSIQQSNSSVNIKAGNVNFYSFFTVEECKYLDFAIRKLTADEQLNIYEVFKDGLETEILFSSLSDDEQKCLNNIIVKLKTIIMNSNDINLRKVFNICRYLYNNLIFEIICHELDYEERDLLGKVIICVEQGIEPIDHISKKYNINKRELVNNLKCILEKILKRLDFLKQQNNLVRKLIKDNNIRVGNEYE
ncbi:MAG: RNA polymerase sigma factor RpoD/SigA [Bacilli bacterium]|nr:RNA polymerase sigma factor RpoD/SigA [Bacilli bacterium]